MRPTAHTHLGSQAMAGPKLRRGPRPPSTWQWNRPRGLRRQNTKRRRLPSFEKGDATGVQANRTDSEVRVTESPNFMKNRSYCSCVPPTAPDRGFRLWYSPTSLSQILTRQTVQNGLVGLDGKGTRHGGGADHVFILQALDPRGGFEDPRFLRITGRRKSQ